MAIKRSLFLSTAAVLLLSACGAPVDKDIEFGAQYWQRVSASEAVYQRGPKVQQMLNRDISRCVVELRELERLGAVKGSIPTNVHTGRVLNPDEVEMEGWDSPERDKHLYAEHSDYHDFPSCMLSNGWERILHVPYDVAEESRANYLKAHIDYKYESKMGKKHHRDTATSNDAGDFSNLN